ncbi:MAG: hypothetical protein UD961_06935 [Bacteroidales bacterium]|nr:hypothetical protein [Bacteroidales bacterium]
MNKNILITGAVSGIGEGCEGKFALQGGFGHIFLKILLFFL